MPSSTENLIKTSIRLNQTVRFVHRSALDPSVEHDDSGHLNLNFVLSNGGNLSPGNVGRPMFWHKETNICCPAIYFHSNPFKTDRKIKPWVDVLLPDEGLVYYNGDNKDPGLSASGGHNSGNKMMENHWAAYSSHDPAIRKQAAPIFVFEHVAVGGSTKGYRKFRGYGLLTKTEIKQEYDAVNSEVFSNYLFEVSLLKVPDTGLDWSWIHDRRNRKLSIDEINRKAPPAWMRFIKNGLSDLYEIRQRIRHYEIAKTQEQVGELTPAHEKILKKIVNHYPNSKDKGRFEAIAALVTQEFFGENYQNGWITPQTSDMGVDYVGRLDLRNHFAPAPVGTVLGGTRLLVLGQAKCRTDFLTTKESAKEIARVAARLQRGYIGVFVTTGTFSEATQKEVAIDGYPIVLINGRQLADLLLQYANRTGLSISKILEDCDSWYINNQRNVPPHFMLHELL